MSDKWESSCCSSCGTYCLGQYAPCILFARTNHKVEHGNLDGYSCCNGDCMKFCFFGLSPCGRGMRSKQREAIEKRFGLEHRGENCCCPVYSLMTNANEVNKRLAVEAKQPGKEKMMYGPQ